MSNISVAVSSAIERQHQETQEISTNTQQAALGAREVSASINKVSSNADQTNTLSNQVSTQIQEVGNLVALVESRLKMVLRQSVAGDRRNNLRIEKPGVQAHLRFNGQMAQVEILNLSCEGMLIAKPSFQMISGNQASFMLGSLQESIQGTVVEVTGQGVRVVFQESQELEAFLQGLLKNRKAA
jgi:hypothetical protein